MNLFQYVLVNVKIRFANTTYNPESRPVTFELPMILLCSILTDRLLKLAWISTD